MLHQLERPLPASWEEQRERFGRRTGEGSLINRAVGRGRCWCTYP